MFVWGWPALLVRGGRRGGRERGRCAQDRQPPLDLFAGREAELASIAQVATGVQAGQPWLVAIEGDRGVGKTARGLTGSPWGAFLGR